MVRTLAAAEPAATEASMRAHVAPETGRPYTFDAVRAAPNAVNTKRYHIFGLLSS